MRDHARDRRREAAADERELRRGVEREAGERERDPRLALLQLRVLQQHSTLNPLPQKCAMIHASA